MFRLEDVPFDLGYRFITRQISLLKDPSHPRLCSVAEFQNTLKERNRGYPTKFLIKICLLLSPWAEKGH